MPGRKHRYGESPAETLARVDRDMGTPLHDTYATRRKVTKNRSSGAKASTSRATSKLGERGGSTKEGKAYNRMIRNANNRRK